MHNNNYCVNLVVKWETFTGKSISQLSDGPHHAKRATWSLFILYNKDVKKFTVTLIIIIIINVTVNFFTSLLYKINRLHVAMHLVSNRSQKMSKLGVNISDTLPTFLFLPHFCVICYVLLNRHKATLNLEWNWIIWVEIHHHQQSYTGLISPR